jgi:type III restriction enzyme
METYWVPGVNHLGTHGRWSFVEFSDVHDIESDFEAKLEEKFNEVVGTAVKLQVKAGT